MSNSALLPGCSQALEQVPQIGNEAKIYQIRLRAASGRSVSRFGVLAAVDIAVTLQLDVRDLARRRTCLARSPSRSDPPVGIKMQSDLRRRGN